MHDLEKLVAATAEFVRTHVLPVDDEHDGDIEVAGGDTLRTRLQADASSRGLLSPHGPKDCGGLGLSMTDRAPVFEAAGYSLFGPVALNINAPDEGNMHLLDHVATPEQRAEFLEPLVRGTYRSAFAMTEPDPGAGSDPSLLATSAVKVDSGWLINGRKAFITGAQGAKVGIVMAKSTAGACMFLVDLPDPAIRIDRVLNTIDSSMPGGHSVLTIDNLRVPADQMLGQSGEGFNYAQVRLSPARLSHCMRWFGATKRANEIATAYAVKRHAFGKPLIDHEGVGFMLADNLIDLKQAELMIDWCADVLDTGVLGTAESSMAKVAVSDALFRVADRCVQTMGGTGVSRDTIVEQVFREIRAFRIYDGPTEVHKWSLAKKIKRDALKALSS